MPIEINIFSDNLFGMIYLFLPYSILLIANNNVLYKILSLFFSSCINLLYVKYSYSSVQNTLIRYILHCAFHCF